MMKACNQTTLAALYCALSLLPASATERYFTYTYEPETMPKGALEYEQWVTLAAGRDAAVGQENYRRWVFREELEYGVTDNYTVSFYLNVSLGITRHFGPRWSVGLEARDNNELPDYQIWENTALYVGPVATYAEERWWATLSVMPQV